MEWSNAKKFVIVLLVLLNVLLAGLNYKSKSGEHHDGGTGAFHL